jgi:hypothetical protein
MVRESESTRAVCTAVYRCERWSGTTKATPEFNQGVGESQWLTILFSRRMTRVQCSSQLAVVLGENWHMSPTRGNP